MGEEADRIVDYMIGEGYMSTKFSPPKRKASFKTCNRCHTTHLHWSLTEEGWRLFSEHGIQHKC